MTNDYPKKCMWCEGMVYKEVFATLVEGGFSCECGKFISNKNKVLRGKDKDDSFILPTGVER
jgi:hypothetical protein|tara:strand:- start:5741 stop:5926 length:186 start_codon:yes stop_codon:yes gene_type:complete